MKTDQMERSLNEVVKVLCNGLGELAEKVRCGANRKELSAQIALMSDSICEHWPNCFTEMNAQKNKAAKTPPKAKPAKAKPAKAKS